MIQASTLLCPNAKRTRILWNRGSRAGPMTTWRIPGQTSDWKFWRDIRLSRREVNYLTCCASFQFSGSIILSITPSLKLFDGKFPRFHCPQNPVLVLVCQRTKGMTLKTLHPLAFTRKGPNGSDPIIRKAMFPETTSSATDSGWKSDMRLQTLEFVKTTGRPWVIFG